MISQAHHYSITESCQKDRINQQLFFIAQECRNSQGEICYLGQVCIYFKNFTLFMQIQFKHPMEKAVSHNHNE